MLFIIGNEKAKESKEKTNQLTDVHKNTLSYTHSYKQTNKQEKLYVFMSEH